MILRGAKRVSRWSAALCCYTCSSPLHCGREKTNFDCHHAGARPTCSSGETQSRHIICQRDSLAGALGCPRKPDVTLSLFIVRRTRVCDCVQKLHGHSCEPLLERPSTRCGFPADGLNHRGNRVLIWCPREREGGGGGGGVPTNSARTCRMSDLQGRGSVVKPRPRTRGERGRRSQRTQQRADLTACL